MVYKTERGELTRTEEDDGRQEGQLDVCQFEGSQSSHDNLQVPKQGPQQTWSEML